ncbi:hypothetical protein ES703_119222 [subsurface metagenome]
MQADAIETVVGNTPPNAPNPGKLIVSRSRYGLSKVIFRFEDGKQLELKVYRAFNDALKYAKDLNDVLRGAKISKNGKVYFKGYSFDGKWVHTVPGKGGR